MTPPGSSSPKPIARPSKGKKTRLQRYLDSKGITSAQLEAATGIPRQSMTKIRAGRDVRRQTMVRILRGLRSIAGQEVQMGEIFDLDPETTESGK